MNTGTVPTDEIRKALNAATPGPWEVKHDETENRHSVYKSPVCYGNAITGWGSVTQTKENAHLIANAPTWLRSLLAERNKLLEALTKIAEQTEDEITEDYARYILSQYINESKPDTATTPLS